MLLIHSFTDPLHPHAQSRSFPIARAAGSFPVAAACANPPLPLPIPLSKPYPLYLGRVWNYPSKFGYR